MTYRRNPLMYAEIRQVTIPMTKENRKERVPRAVKRIPMIRGIAMQMSMFSE